MVVLRERHSAQPSLGVRQEHVLKVLAYQHEHLHPLVSLPLRRLAQADGTRSLDSAHGNGKLLYICASSQDLQWVCEWVFEFK